MRNFLHLGNIDPVPAMLELQRQPELWNQRTARRTYADTPHATTDDIWVRWIEEDALDNNQPRELCFLNPWYRLPALRPIVFPLMAKAQAVQLGGIFITRIPPGEGVAPHVDQGWHANWFNTKVFVALQSNPDCLNVVERDLVRMKSGECWAFRNTVVHEITNGGNDDRIAVIVCMRCES